MKVYIPKSMIKKSQSQARHNSYVRASEESEKLTAVDLFDLDQELGNPLIESLKVTLIVASAMASVLWWFYG